MLLLVIDLVRSPSVLTMCYIHIWPTSLEWWCAKAVAKKKRVGALIYLTQIRACTLLQAHSCVYIALYTNAIGGIVQELSLGFRV
jgi:hypothetical protein